MRQLSWLSLISSLFTILSCIEFRKNSDILSAHKPFPVSVTEIERLEELTDLVERQQSFVVMFHVDWCGHCKQFIPLFKEASRYKLSEGIKFIIVNCKTKALCTHFKVRGYPNIQIFLKGKQVNVEVTRELEPFLELIDKLNTPDLVPVISSEVNKFSNLYGEVSFLALMQEKDKEFSQCLSNIISENKALLYFGKLNEESFTLKNGDVLYPPALLTLGVNENLNIYYAVKDEFNCDDLIAFVNNYKLPLNKRLDRPYLKKLQSVKRTSVITILDTKNQEDIRFLRNTFQSVAYINRNITFTYLDSNEDVELTKQLGLPDKVFPKVMIYNPSIRKLYVDDFIYRNDSENMVRLEKLVSDLNLGLIQFNPRFWFEEWLERNGIEMNQRNMTIFAASIFFVILVVFVIFNHFKMKSNIRKGKEKPLTENKKYK